MFDDKINSQLTDLSFLAAFYNCDERTIQLWAKKWEAKGFPVREDRGQYNFIDFARNRIKDLEDKVNELEKGDETLYKLKQEYQRMHNEEKEERLRKIKNRSVDYQIVRDAWCLQLKVIVNNMEALAGRITTRLGGDRTMFNKINTMVNEVRSAIAGTQLELTAIDEIEQVMEEYSEKSETDELSDEE